MAAKAFITSSSLFQKKAVVGSPLGFVSTQSSLQDVLNSSMAPSAILVNILIFIVMLL